MLYKAPVQKMYKYTQVTVCIFLVKASVHNLQCSAYADKRINERPGNIG